MFFAKCGRSQSIQWYACHHIISKWNLPNHEFSISPLSCGGRFPAAFMRMRNCEVIMRLSSSFQRGSELADKSTNAPFSQKSAHIFSYAFLHSAKFGIEAASGFDGENSHVNSRVSEFESNSNSCGLCVGLNFAPSENLTAAKYLVESSSREITAAFFSGVSSALLCFCGEFQSPERLAVCASEYGNEK